MDVKDRDFEEKVEGNGRDEDTANSPCIEDNHPWNSIINGLLQTPVKVVDDNRMDQVRRVNQSGHRSERSPGKNRTDRIQEALFSC